MSNSYHDFYRHSIEDPNSFWGEQAKLIDWHKPFSKVLDYSKPPFSKWFSGGQTKKALRPKGRSMVKQKYPQQSHAIRLAVKKSCF